MAVGRIMDQCHQSLDVDIKTKAKYNVLQKEGGEMAVSIRLSKAEDSLIRGYADTHGLSVSEFMKQSALEKIEDELDMELFEEALEDFRENPQTHTLGEVEKELGLE